MMTTTKKPHMFILILLPSYLTLFDIIQISEIVLLDDEVSLDKRPDKPGTLKHIWPNNDSFGQILSDLVSLGLAGGASSCLLKLLVLSSVLATSSKLNRLASACSLLREAKRVSTTPSASLEPRLLLGPLKAFSSMLPLVRRVVSVSRVRESGSALPFATHQFRPKRFISFCQMVALHGKMRKSSRPLSMLKALTILKNTAWKVLLSHGLALGASLSSSTWTWLPSTREWRLSKIQGRPRIMNIFAKRTCEKLKSDLW